jgi:hypothetical protein
VLAEILQERVVSSRNRRNPRGVKRKMSNFPIRRKTNRVLPPIIDPARVDLKHMTLEPDRRHEAH